MARATLRHTLATPLSYSLLTAELKKRFTPVQLTAIQTQMFHDRVQGAKESVDEYAQALRKLFAKAYPSVLRGTSESNSMGQTVLANQFVAGLRPELKAKVVGTDGNIGQLLVKARFEEAKRKELATVRSTPQPKRPVTSQNGTAPPRSTPLTPPLRVQVNKSPIPNLKVASTAGCRGISYKPVHTHDSRRTGKQVVGKKLQWPVLTLRGIPRVEESLLCHRRRR